MWCSGPAPHLGQRGCLVTVGVVLTACRAIVHLHSGLGWLPREGGGGPLPRGPLGRCRGGFGGETFPQSLCLQRTRRRHVSEARPKGSQAWGHQEPLVSPVAPLGRLFSPRSRTPHCWRSPPLASGDPWPERGGPVFLLAQRCPWRLLGSRGCPSWETPWSGAFAEQVSPEGIREKDAGCSTPLCSSEEPPAGRGLTVGEGVCTGKPDLLLPRTSPVAGHTGSGQRAPGGGRVLRGRLSPGPGSQGREPARRSPTRRCCCPPRPPGDSRAGLTRPRGQQVLSRRAPCWSSGLGSLCSGDTSPRPLPGREQRAGPQGVGQQRGGLRAAASAQSPASPE